MSDINPDVQIPLPQDAPAQEPIPADAPVPAPYITADHPQSDPVVGFQQLVQASETKSVEVLRAAEADAKVLLCDKLDQLEKHLEGVLTELNQQEALVVRDGRSLFDNFLGAVRRAKAGLAK